MQSISPSAKTTGQEARPLLIGLHAAKANALPGLIIQIVMVAVVLSYYFSPFARSWLANLEEIKRRTGFLFSFVSAALAGGCLPVAMTVLLFQKCRIQRRNLGDLVFGILYWGCIGVIVDGLYRGQTWVFGSHADFSTICKKVAVDQFGYNTLFGAPATVAAFEWKNQDYCFEGLSRLFTFGFYKGQIFPALLATWGVWIPVVSMVYALPPLLQIPLFSLALTFWVMLFSWIDKGTAR